MTMDACMHDVLNTITAEALTVLRLNNKVTLSEKEIITAIQLCFPGEVARHAKVEAQKACAKFDASNPKPTSGKSPKKIKRKPQPASARAGLQFPVGRIKTMLKARGAKVVSPKAAIALAASIEYIAAEVLELAGNAASDLKRSRISPRCIMLAIRNDAELNSLITATIAQGGVLPNVHQSLLPVKKNSKASK